MTRLAALALLLIALAPGVVSSALAQTDPFTGRWEGTFVEPNGDSNPIQLNLTQTGKMLAGTMGPNAGRQWKIEKGEVLGAKATFEVHQGGATHRFTLTLDKTKLQGEMRTEIKGQTLTSQVEAEKKVAASAGAGGFTGKWEGTFVEPNGDSNPLQLNLTETGPVLTGTMGPRTERQWTIEKGQVSGAKATFEVHQGGAVHRLTLTLEKDKLQGEMRSEVEGQTVTSNVDLARAGRTQ